MVIFKSILHNIGVLFVGFVVAYIGKGVDTLMYIPAFGTSLTFILGSILLSIGFGIRVWATYYFYLHQMKVISLEPQKKLLTAGPYKYSRNPLYLGGNVFIFFGACIVLGTLSGVLLTVLGLYFTNHMIAREEEQLEKKFGNEWKSYAKRVRRWI